MIMFPRSRLIPLPLWIFFNEPLVFILSVQMGWVLGFFWGQSIRVIEIVGSMDCFLLDPDRMIYGLFYAVQARVVSLYHHDLNESIHMSCLHVLSMALGAICASKLNTRGLSAICDRLGIVSERVRHRPEYKLRCMIPGILLLPLGSFCFASLILIISSINPNLIKLLTLKNQSPFKDIGLFFLGAGVIFGFRKAGSYIIDVKRKKLTVLRFFYWNFKTFGDRAASALTAMHLIRRVESFVVPFVINLTIKSRLKYELIILGASLSSLLIICPMPFLLFLYGHRIRRLPIL
ncbi:hypothetical protein VP01_2373g5 [Puccinia sorghi]|uniref:Uncharacterized protein n=1 Tax=Puccinia sorghi TaxID=27349 RepID=A0A0L6V764_9BASI|nr:hypothetical protein VP01_2373g5 [Puccinia sorghi]